MAWRHSADPDLLEKIISAVCYLPIGFFVGIGYILFNGKGSHNRFFRYNFYQAIFLSVLLLVISEVLKVTDDILISILHSFTGVLGEVTVYRATAAIVWIADILLKALFLLLPYGLIWSLMGKYADIPFISDVIRRQV